ncbi:MAG: transcription initiation factor IIB [Methanocellales archaeon]
MAREVEKEGEKEKVREEEEVEEETTQLKCPECGSRQLVHDYERAELVCDNCGLVIDKDFIDMGPEWRAFDHDQRMKRSRVGAPMTYTIHDKGLSTMIDWRNRDSYGKPISSKNRAQLYRLRKWQRRIRVSNATERNLAFALSELDRMASALGLPRNVRETAAVIYRKAVDKNLIRGRSIEGVAAAALYAACRQISVPRTLDEIAQVSRVSRKEIGRTYRFISRELGLKLMPTSPIDYVPRFCSGLNLKGEVQSKAIEILRQAGEKELTSGRGPTGVAAAAIYISSILCGERRTQREVAEVAGVTEVTIRNRYKELAEELDIEIIL